MTFKVVEFGYSHIHANFSCQVREGDYDSHAWHKVYSYRSALRSL
jgi:hypothetical protein